MSRSACVRAIVPIPEASRSVPSMLNTNDNWFVFFSSGSCKGTTLTWVTSAIIEIGVSSVVNVHE